MFDVLIIGCGVVGAAAAYNLSQYNLKLGILEKENDVATGTTKANSAIIHAGYDPKPGTLMAQLNVRGAQLTQEICQKLEVEYQQIGSLVVAFSPEEMEKVEGLYRQGIKNGVPRLKLVDAQELRTLEKDISPKAVGALYAPTAAIVDPWDLCLAMAQTAVVNGAQLGLNSEVTEIKKTENGFLVRAGGKEYETKIIFNAAGIYGDRVHNLVAKPSFTICPRSGQYYLLDKSQGEKARHIIFQCPVGGTKGVLVAPTVHGNLIVGPDSTPVEGQGTDTTLEGLEFVRERGAKTIPSINFKENIRNFAGLRAAADREDFIIEGAEGAQGFFDLVGIKSPGLSAAAAIGERAVELARGAGLELARRQSFCDTRRVVHFNKLSKKEKQELIATDPSYGRVVCRCETITEGEILACLKAPIPPVSIDGVKRRVGAGMGRCQGGFCSPRVLEILAQHRGVAPEEICLDTQGSFILTGSTKGGKE